MISIKNKYALITGSSRGIGQQIAIGLAELGCNIIVHGRNKDNCNKTLQLLKKYSIKSYCIAGDLSEDKQVRNIIEQIRNLNINVDILYNNAGIMTSYHENIWEHRRYEWLNTYKVNVIAVYELCSAFIPTMIDNSFGRIINLTSGMNEEPELAPYGVSKWAVDKLTNEIASKLINTSVRINTLDPTWLRTDLGGKYADNPVEAVLPGALLPALIDNDGPNGYCFTALNQKYIKIHNSY